MVRLMAGRPSTSSVRSLYRALRDTLGSEAVTTDPTVLERYSGDWSGAPAALPDLVVRPARTEEVSKVLALANAHGVPVTPRGLGTGKAGGAIPVHGGAVLGLERLDRIGPVQRQDMCIEVGPGVVLEKLWNTVEGEALFYPPDPNSFDICSIGGNIACNAGGPRALKYGVTRNYVLGLEIVLPSGQVMQVGKRTLKHATGYDLASLIVGSEGTLGIITKAELRLLPLPTAVRAGVVGFSDVRSAAEAVNEALARGHQPRAFELLDGHALDALRNHAPGGVMEGARSMLIFELDGFDEARVETELEGFATDLLRLGALDVRVAQSESERRRVWAPRNRLSESLRATAEAKLSEDIVVPRSRVPDMIDAAGQIAERRGVRVATYGHAGDGNLHVNILFDRAQSEAAQAAVEDVLRAAVRLEGTLSGEHGIGLTKRPYLGLEHPSPKIELQRALKHAFDPHGILNPGKIFPDGDQLS